jgi:hypothetical protein
VNNHTVPFILQIQVDNTAHTRQVEEFSDRQAHLAATVIQGLLPAKDQVRPDPTNGG